MRPVRHWCPHLPLHLVFLMLPLRVPQVLLGWKYGDCVDEKAKIHPQLRSYKSLTEKVQNVKCKIYLFIYLLFLRIIILQTRNILNPGSYFWLLCCRRKSFTDGQLESPWGACWRWAGASTGPRMERACLSSARVRKCERSLRLHRYQAELLTASVHTHLFFPTV